MNTRLEKYTKKKFIANKYFVNLGTGNLSGSWPSYDLDANS